MEPGDRLGRYEVLAAIGKGGMGAVYRARDQRIGREVAIKVLPPELAEDPDRRRRVLVEARTAGSLNHPNVLVIHDVELHEDTPYLVTELLRGETLRERLAAGPLEVPKALAITRQLADGLGAAHAAGIIHRDIKPSNVFLCEGGCAKLLDFGLARKMARAEDATLTDGAITATGAILGTVGYMAPEQVRGREVDHRSDIFALGAVLYEMVAGRRAFEGETHADLAIAIVRDDPAPLEHDAVDRIARRAMAKSPADRFQSTDELIAALDQIEPDTADTRSLPPRVARRRRGPGLAVVAVALALALAVALAVWRPWASSADPVASVEPPRPHLVRRALTHTAAPLHVSWAAISPDGRRAVYSLGMTGTQVWIQDVESAEPYRKLQLPAEAVRVAAMEFFPDGRLLLLTTSADGNAVPYALDLDTGEREVVFPGVVPTQPSIAITPDGRALAYEGDGALRLATRDGAISSLVRLPEGENVSDLSWSPDGQYLAFVHWRVAAAPTLEIVTRDGSRVERVFGDPRASRKPMISGVSWADPERLLLTRDAGEKESELVSIGIIDGHWDEKPPRLEQPIPGENVGLLRVRGERVFYISHWSTSDVYIASTLEPGAPGVAGSVLTDNDGADWAASWTPDGRVLLMSRRSGSFDVYAQAPGGVATPVATGPADQLLPVASGEAILFWQEDGEACALHRIVEGKEPTRLFETPSRWSLYNGCPTVRCASNRPNRCVLVQIDSEHISVQRIDPTTGALGDSVFRHATRRNEFFDLSPDGDQLVFAREDKTDRALYVANLDSGKTVIHTWPHPFVPHDVGWLPDGSGWIATGTLNDDTFPQVLVELRPGKEPRELRRYNTQMHNPAVSPDGSQVSFVIERYQRDLIVLEPNTDAS